MSEKVVLPKFDVPGKQMHPAVKLALGAGSMLVLAIALLGVGQKALIIIGPEQAIQRIGTLGRIGLDRRPPAALQ